MELQIYEKASMDVSTDRRVALANNHIGQYYIKINKPDKANIKINKPDKAKVFLEKELEIYEKSSQDSTVDLDIAHSASWMKICLSKLNQIKEQFCFVEKN